MKRKLLFLGAVALLIGACADDPSQPAATRQMAQAGAEGRYIIELNGNGPADLAASVSALGGTVEYANTDAGIVTVTGFNDAAARELAKSGGVADVYADIPVQLAPSAETLDATALDAAISSVTNPAGAVVYNFQWNMRVIKANTAWAAGELGSANVTVAILDTGIDYDDFDMNGLVDLSRSKSFVPSDDAFMTAFLPARNKIDDLNGHGTNVASQVSTKGGFFAGVNSRVKLIGVKVLSASGSGSLSGILNGIIWAADHDADVANMSLGIPGGVDKRAAGRFMSSSNRVFNYAYRKGMLIVVAAGNEATNLDNNGLNFSAYCEASHVICVSATGPTSATNTNVGPWFNQDALAFYSNYGKSAITVAAPGGSLSGFVWSICARHRLFGFSAGLPVFGCNTAAPTSAFIVGYIGTSQATPHVAGLAAQLVGKLGANNPAQVKAALVKDGVDDLGPKGADLIYGQGRINVAKALGL